MVHFSEGWGNLNYIIYAHIYNILLQGITLVLDRDSYFV